LGWVWKLLGWVGLGDVKWTHVNLCNSWRHECCCRRGYEKQPWTRAVKQPTARVWRRHWRLVATYETRGYDGYENIGLSLRLREEFGVVLKLEWVRGRCQKCGRLHFPVGWHHKFAITVLYDVLWCTCFLIYLLDISVVHIAFNLKAFREKFKIYLWPYPKTILFLSLTKFSIPLSHRISVTSCRFSLLMVRTHALHLTSSWSNHIHHSKSLIAPSDMLHLIFRTSFLHRSEFLTRILLTPSQRPSFEHASLNWYTLLSPSITFHCVNLSSKLTCSEIPITHLSLFLSVGLTSWL